MKNLSEFKLEEIANSVVANLDRFNEAFPESEVTHIYNDFTSYSSEAFAAKIKSLTDSQMNDIIAKLLYLAYKNGNTAGMDQPIKKVRRLLVRTQKYINENYVEFNDVSTNNAVIYGPYLPVTNMPYILDETFFEKVCRKLRNFYFNMLDKLV